MPIALEISTADFATPAIASTAARLDPARLAPVIGRSAVNVVRHHLLERNLRPNRLGAKKTNFYQRAANATQFQAEGDSVIVSTHSIGIAQRYFGGTIRTKNAKYLTIPARAEAHGKRAREFDDLEVVFGRGGRPIGLARRVSTRIGFRRDRRTGNPRAFSRGDQGGEILYWLKPEVTQQPDPTVLPTAQQIGEQVVRDVSSFVAREAARGGAS